MPKKIRVSYGRTMQSAPYESIRLDVAIEKDVIGDDRRTGRHSRNPFQPCDQIAATRAVERRRRHSPADNGARGVGPVSRIGVPHPPGRCVDGDCQACD